MNNRLFWLAALMALTAGAQARLNLDIRRPLANMPRGDLKELIPGQILVKFSQSRAALIAESPLVRQLSSDSLVPNGTFRTRIASTGWTLWTVPDWVDTAALAKDIKQNPLVAAAQPVNRIYPLWTDPNDPDYWYDEYDEELVLDFFDEEAHFRRMWHLDDINAQQGWTIYPNRWWTAAQKPQNVPSIAAIDTGADMNHPDFRNTGGAGTNITQGGQLDHALSKQFRFGEIDPNGTPEDQHGHGTHVLGIAVSAGNSGAFDQNNYNGVLGIGYNSKGIMLRVFDSQGVGTDADAAAAIFYAADMGVDIINLSIGTENFSQLFQDAVTYAYQKGSLVVAAGNEDGSGGGDLGPIYPAACSGALGVSANGPGRIPATGTYSGFGSYVDMAAPGGDVWYAADLTAYYIQFIWSTAMRTPGTLYQMSVDGTLFPPYYTKYAYLAGTSQATPMVSGAASLYYAKFGLDQQDGWANVRAYRAIERSAISVMGAPNGGWEPYQGYGSLILNTLVNDAAGRSTSVGSIEGMVYYNATPVSNVQVKAKKNQVTYSTTTRADGGYRFDQMPPGVYAMETAPFGALKKKNQLVKAGSDATGTDFWAGTFWWDDTPPTLVKFTVPNQIQNPYSFQHWGYDVETSIDKIEYRVGTSPGGQQVVPWTELLTESTNVTLGVNLQQGARYYIAVRYTNGAEMVTTVEKSIGKSPTDKPGTRL